VVFRMESRCRLGRQVWISVVLPTAERASVRTVYWSDEHGTPHPGELQFDLLISADDVNEAIANARPSAVSLASMCSYLANGPVGEPRLVLIHEVGSDDTTREYHFFIADTLKLRSTTRVGTTALNDLLAKMHSLNSSSRSRVERAMHWRAVALGLDDPLERLQSVLNAFEALNTLLADHLGVDRNETRKCKQCGAETKAPVASGVHEWLKRECGEEVARETRDVRNGLIHGFRAMDELQASAKTLIEQVERALMTAIGVCTGMGDINDLIDWPPLVPSLPFALAMHGTCTGLVEAAYFGDGSLPEFEPTIRIKSSSLVSGEDRATVELEQNAKARLPDGVAVQITGTTMPRDAGSRLEGDPTLRVTRAKHDTD
jgi:hypothetical protein